MHFLLPLPLHDLARLAGVAKGSLCVQQMLRTPAPPWRESRTADTVSLFSIWVQTAAGKVARSVLVSRHQMMVRHQLQTHRPFH